MRFGSRREDSVPSSDNMAVSERDEVPYEQSQEFSTADHWQLKTLDQDGEPHYEYILKEMYVPPGNEGSFAGQNDVVE